MPKLSLKEQLAALEKREEKLAAKRAELRALEKAEARKLEARRQKLVGAAAIAEAERNPEFAKLLTPLVKKIAESEIDKETLAELLASWQKVPPVKDAAA